MVPRRAKAGKSTGRKKKPARKTARKRTETSGVQAETPAPRETPFVFPIVGIGTSAGGLAALQRFFGALPREPGLAFVVVQHLDPTHKSETAELLEKRTQLPVVEVTDRQRVEVVLKPRRRYFQ